MPPQWDLSCVVCYKALRRINRVRRYINITYIYYILFILLVRAVANRATKIKGLYLISIIDENTFSCSVSVIGILGKCFFFPNYRNTNSNDLIKLSSVTEILTCFI